MDNELETLAKRIAELEQELKSSRPVDEEEVLSYIFGRSRSEGWVPAPKKPSDLIAATPEEFEALCILREAVQAVERQNQASRRKAISVSLRRTTGKGLLKKP